MFLIYPFNPGITSIFKGGNESNIDNYSSISVLPCFPKMLEKIMYNRVYKHLNENNLFYIKQFVFQKAHSTEHAIIQPVDEINSSFFYIGSFY